MTSELVYDVTPIARSAVAPESLDTVRALCHDLRQPLAAIRLLAEAKGGDVRLRLDAIREQAQWLADMVEDVIGDAVGDQPRLVDVVDLVRRCALRAAPTSRSEIRFIGTHPAMAVTSAVALSRAVGCLLDNAVRAAGTGGHVIVEVTGTAYEISILILDDGPGLGHVRTHNSLGLTITRALVGACGGGFELRPGTAGGAVAQIVIPGLRSGAVAS